MNNTTSLDDAAQQSLPTLSQDELANLPLTDRNLTDHEVTNLAVVLGAYDDAEANALDVEGFRNAFAPDGVVDDVVGQRTYDGDAVRDVLTNMIAILPDVSREISRITVREDTVCLELSINGTFDGALPGPDGEVQGNGARVAAPTADFWYLKDGKVLRFNCYVAYSTMYSQMGIEMDWASSVDS